MARKATPEELDKISKYHPTVAAERLKSFALCLRSIEILSRGPVWCLMVEVDKNRHSIRDDLALAAKVMQLLPGCPKYVIAYYIMATLVNDTTHIEQARAQLRCAGCRFELNADGFVEVSDLLNVLCRNPDIPSLQLVGQDIELPNELVQVLEQATNITVLTIQNCVHALMMRPVSRMTWLRSLSIFDTAYVTLDDMLSPLTGLTTLRLYLCSKLVTLPPSLLGMTALQDLSIESCSLLEYIPDFIGELTALRRLAVTCCGAVRAIPASIGQLTRLETLSLASCRSLTAVPHAIGRLKLLSVLNLSGCIILEALPSCIASLPLLRALNLTSCRFVAKLYTRFKNVDTGEYLGYYDDMFIRNNLDEHVLPIMERSYAPSKLLALVLAARRKRVRHIPDEIWLMVLTEFVTCPVCIYPGCGCILL